MFWSAKKCFGRPKNVWSTKRMFGRPKTFFVDQNLFVDQTKFWSTKKIFFKPIFCIFLNLETPLADCAVVWRQTMFFTRVLALLGTKPCYLRWLWRSTELISDVLEQNMGILSRRFALFYFCFFTPLVSFSFFFYRFTTPLVSFSFSCFLFFFKSAPPLVWPKK